MVRNTFLFIILLAIVYSCDNTSGKKGDIPEHRISEKGDTIYIVKNNDGILISESTIKNGKKHGFSWDYYTDGKVKMETLFKTGKKDGISRWYYDNGQLYQETPYNDGKIQGLRKRFSREGDLIAEIPYENSQPVPGTKEYTKIGELYDDYPTIFFYWDESRADQNIYRARMYLTNKKREVDFYYFKEENGKSVRIGLPVGYNGIGDLEFRIKSLDELPDSMLFFCVYETPRGNPMVLSDYFKFETSPIPE
jgi:hypothetical protein